MKLYLVRFFSRFHAVSPWEEPRLLEHEAYYRGAHRVDEEKGIGETEAHFAKKIADVQSEAIERVKAMEAPVQHLTAIAPHYNDLWQGVKLRIGDNVPPVVLPVIVAFVGAFAIIAETRLIAPAMDVLGISDPVAQLYSALGIAGCCAAALHFAWDTFECGTMSTARKLTQRLIAVGTVLLLIAWGIFRGLEVGFAADLADNPLGQFLARHPFLASIFYVFVTLVVPVVAAMAAQYSSKHLHDWWEWSQTRRKAHKISEQLSTLSKRLEAEKAALAHRIQALRDECQEWKALYSQHHQRGLKFGARQEPYWTVPLKATMASGLGLLFMGPGILLLTPFIGILWPFLWLGLFLHYRRLWISPDPYEFFKLARVEYAERAADANDAEEPPDSALARRVLKSRKAAKEKEALP